MSTSREWSHAEIGNVSGHNFIKHVSIKNLLSKENYCLTQLDPYSFMKSDPDGKFQYIQSSSEN